MKDQSYDLIVIGAGCAGLSLAHRLSLLPDLQSRILFLEARAQYVHDKIWCHWEHDRSLLDARWRGYSWSRMQIGDENRTVTVETGSKAYVAVESLPFYRSVVDDVARSSHLSLRMDSKVSMPLQREGESFRIPVGSDVFQSPHVLDTRPTMGRLRYPGMWQSFLGWEIETDASRFDPETITLMEFVRPSSYVLEFLYVLPFSERHALVEWTVFDPRPIAPEVFSDRLAKKILAIVKGSATRRIRVERGVLPMGRLESPHSEPGLTHASLGAGMARISTGYAFSNIQRWAARCAGEIETRGKPCGPLSVPKSLDWMDQFFLARMQRAPERAPDFLMDLFEKTDHQNLLEFLEGRASAQNLMSVVGSQIPGFLGIKGW